MSDPHRKRHPPFVALPRHRRSNAVIRLKNQIRRSAAYYGGRFTSDLVMEDESGQPSQWLDFCFAGTDRFTLWNAGIITAKKAFDDAVCSQARARTWADLSDAERHRETDWKVEPVDRSRTGKVLTYRMVMPEPVRYPQFDGRTFDEQVDLLKAAIARDEPPAIHESFALDRRYRYGIGLHIVVDVPTIDRAAVEAAMDRFMALGETDWVAAEPVPRDRLPVTVG